MTVNTASYVAFWPGARWIFDEVCYKVRQKNDFFRWHIGRKDASFGDKSSSVVILVGEISVINGSSFYLQLSQANMMLSLGADPPSPTASGWCFISFAVSGALHSPFGGRFCTWKGRAASKPRGSGFCSLLRGGHIAATCTLWLLCK